MARRNINERDFAKAEDLKVVFDFAIDDSKNAIHRTEQVREIIGQMLTLARKKGRPSVKEEDDAEAA